MSGLIRGEKGFFFLCLKAQAIVVKHNSGREISFERESSDKFKMVYRGETLKKKPYNIIPWMTTGDSLLVCVLAGILVTK